MTSDRLNKASFRQKLNLVSKSIIKNQNSIELLLKDIKHFNTQNPVVDSIIRQVDIGKKKDLSKLLKKAPDIKDLELWSKFNKLLAKDDFFNRGNDSNNNNNNSNFYLHLLPNPQHLILDDPHIYNHHLNCQILGIFSGWFRRKSFTTITLYTTSSRPISFTCNIKF